MKLIELRKMAALSGSEVGAFHHSFGSAQAAELATDIDQSIENAKHIAYADGYQAGCRHTNVPSVDGWDYRKAVRTGWDGAINQMRARIANELEICREVGAMLGILDEMRQANDVPDMNPGERKMADPPTVLKSWSVITAHENELAKLRPVLEQMRERIAYLEKQDRNTLEVFEEQRGMIRKLEQHPELLGSSAKHADRAVEELNKRITELEDWKQARLDWEGQEAQKIRNLETWRSRVTQG